MSADIQSIIIIADRFEREVLSRTQITGAYPATLSDSDALAIEGESILRMYEAASAGAPGDPAIAAAMARHLVSMARLHASVDRSAIYSQESDTARAAAASQQRACQYLYRAYVLHPQPQSAMLMAALFRSAGFHATACHWYSLAEHTATIERSPQAALEARTARRDLEAALQTTDAPLSDTRIFPTRQTPGLLPSGAGLAPPLPQQSIYTSPAWQPVARQYPRTPQPYAAQPYPPTTGQVPSPYVAQVVPTQGAAAYGGPPVAMYSPQLYMNQEAPDANNALILSILSIFCFGFITAPLALYYGIKAKKAIRECPGLLGGGKATAGIIIGSIVLSIYGIAFVLGIISAMPSG